ncbi:MAG: DUF3098 domain-containing protein [Muribaculaceae bacterium]|nr:DUF3098 domain-containing protein [Muribaculaceae bacterium]
MEQKNSTTQLSNQSENTESYVRLPLVKTNFILMSIAGAMIIAGFLLMLGGSSTAEEFNPDIFSTRRIVVGPTIAFLGFLFMGFGIIYRPRRKE